MARSKKPSKTPPEGYAKIKPTIEKLLLKLKQAQKESLRSKTSKEALWPIIRINHEISRYVYELYYKRELILKELYDWLTLQKYVNQDLIAKWRKQGYESLCCVQCILKSQYTHGNTCICRVPSSKRAEDKQEIECMTCGCSGCASND